MKRTVLSLFLAALCLGANAQTLMFENFENIVVTNEVGPLPTGWTMYGDNLTNIDNFTQFGSGWVVSQVETANKAAASVSGNTAGATCDRWLVTPAVALPDANQHLTFRVHAIDESAPEKLRIAVSVSGTDKSDFTTTLADYTFDGTNGTTAGWNTFDLPLAQFSGQTVHIAFINHGNSYFVFLDDVKVSSEFINMHMALLENFTSSYCSNCPAGHTNLSGAYEGLEDRVAWVSHHAGFRNDAMTIAPSLQLEALYGNNNTYAPAMMIDRSMAYSEGNPGPVHEVDGSQTIHYQLSQCTSTPSALRIALRGIDYNADTRQLQVTVDGRFLSDQQADNPRLALYLCEDSVIGLQTNGYGENNNYRHDHVIRASLTDVWGDPDIVASTTAGSTFGHTFTYTLPQGLRADKCYLVAFVANYGSSVTSGRKVINTVKSGYITDDPGSPLSIADAEPVTASVFPNPAANVVYISAGQTIHRVTVVNPMGSRVMDTGRASADMVELNVSTLAPGLYLVAVETASGTVVKKMSVAR